MMGKVLLVAGAAAGYVLGTKAGRERYDQIKAKAEQVWQDPKVQEKVNQAKRKAAEGTEGSGAAWTTGATSSGPTAASVDG